MLASLCCSGERLAEGGWEAEVAGLAGSVEVDAESVGLLAGRLLAGLPDTLSVGADVPPELPDDKPAEDGEPRLPEDGSAADCPRAGSRVGPQLAASRKKAMRMAAAALRMFQACLLPCLLRRFPRLIAEHPELAPMRFEKRTRAGFLFKAAGAFSLLLPGAQTNQGRFCGGGGSRLPTSWV